MMNVHYTQPLPFLHYVDLHNKANMA